MNIILFDKLDIDNKIPVSSREGRHINNILKLKKGDSFRIGEWGASRGEGLITSIDDNFIAFAYNKSSHIPTPIPVVLIIAMIRPICMKRVLRFIGECGIYAVIFTGCEYSEKSYFSSTLYEMENVLSLIKEGAEISRDSVKPIVYFTHDVLSAIEQSKVLGVKNRYILDIRQDTQKLRKENEYLSAIAIGPERGWSEKEVEVFIKNGFLSYNIGKRVLRSEESAIVSLYPWL